MQAQSLSLTIAQLVEQLFTTRRITRNDQQRLMTALLSKTALSSEEQIQVNRVFDSLKQGYIRVVD
ncbi:hypothetical protein [Coleofasciculus sp. H7-2]|uniref:hypothetical protein n=1 Tax=Coleofasciculus sp. H7-2 TaxID=3351545 RepID=UPI00366E53F4